MRHPVLGPIRFTPWDWQLALMNLWQAGKSTITNKSRQVGASWSAVAYVNWLLNFHPEIDILLLSQKQDKAEKLLAKLTYFYNRLPMWLRARTVVDSRTNFQVAIRYFDETQTQWVQGNGSASSLTTTGSSGAGEAARAVIIDEFALMTERHNDEEVFAAIAPTIIHGGQMIILSTPRGSFGEFYRIWGETLEDVVELGIVGEQIENYREWNKAVMSHADELEMVPFAVHYSMCYHDEGWLKQATQGLAPSKADKIREHFAGIKYDDTWRENQAKRLKLSKNQVAQEFQLVFESLHNVAFDTEDINACYRNPRKYPWVQELIDRSSYFYIGIDTAEGITTKNREPDYGSIVVLNQMGIQVYGLHTRSNIDEWAGRTAVDPVTGKAREIKGTVLKVIERFRPCTVILEKNGGGLTVQNRIEPHLPDDVDFLVLAMSGAIKPQLVSDLQAEMADEQAMMVQGGKAVTIRQHILTDYFTVRCFRQYVKTGPGKYQAATGFFDDPVVAYLWAAYGRRIRGAYDSVAVLPKGRDTSRSIAIDKVDDLQPDEFGRTYETYGPAFIPKDDLQEGLAMNPYTDLIGGRSLTGETRQLGGRERILEGRQ